MHPQFKLIIGIGNPGAEYERTYHNAGHLFLDYCAQHLGGETSFALASSGLFSYLTTPQGILIKTNVFMNKSGKAVSAALRYFDIGPEAFVVCHDESDLMIGSHKLSFDRGAAGHKGVASIVAALDHQNFWRLRLGIRPAEEKTRRKAEEFVLKKIGKQDMATLANAFTAAYKEIFSKP